MTHPRSKSNMLFNSRTRTDSKPSWQRRRFTKTSATVNGEYDPDLALAIQESLKQAEIDALKAKDNQDSKVLEIESEACKENRTVNMSQSSPRELSNETKQLKDLVSVHMDLIQQQQDVINQKDKTIKTLKAENNALQCRLQRMERRLALLKQKEEMGGSPHIVQSPPPKPGTMSYTEPIISPAAEKQSHKRKLESTPTIRKPQASETSRPSPMKTSTAFNTSIETPRALKPELHKKKRVFHSEGVETDSSHLLNTNSHYHVSYCEPVSEEIELEPRPDIIRGAESQLEVECPSYRIKTYTNLYVIEGTEDHEDETFIRRHQKPEIEEKRRKRWDNQRLREEKMYEKLKEGREGRRTLYDKTKKAEDPVDSFYPHLEDISHIAVLDKLVVTAFGQPVPFVKQEEFLFNTAKTDFYLRRFDCDASKRFLTTMDFNQTSLISSLKTEVKHL